MAEVQKTTLSGELSQRFIEFVVMHAQNAALFLGQIPNPRTGEAEVNLDLARMFIDQLAMIQEKMRRNPRRQKQHRHQNRRTNRLQTSQNHRRRSRLLSPKQNPERNSLKATGRSADSRSVPFRSAVAGEEAHICARPRAEVQTGVDNLVV